MVFALISRTLIYIKIIYIYINYSFIIIYHIFQSLSVFSLSVSLFLSLSLSLSPVPLPKVNISPGSVHVTYNSAVNLTCEVQSLTTPTVNWINDTDVILPSTSFVSKDNNSIYTSTLILEQVTLEYIGEYICTAENVGGEISDVINVTVYGKYLCVFIYPSFYCLS